MLIIDVKDMYKRKFIKTGTLKELRRRKEFVKPSVRRRAEMLKAAYKLKNYGGE